MRPYRHNKFSPRSEAHVFLKYPQEYAGYVCFNHVNNKFIISKDVTFLEDNFDLNPNLHLCGRIESNEIQISEEIESCPVLAKIDVTADFPLPSEDQVALPFSTSPSTSQVSDSPPNVQISAITDPLPHVQVHPMVTRA